MKRDEQVKAVEMVREIRDRQSNLLQGRSAEERRRYYADQAQRLHKRLRLVSPPSHTPPREHSE